MLFRSEERAEHHETVIGTEDRVGCPLGVRHQTDDVAAGATDSGDVVEAAVGVVHVADDDPIVGPQFGEGALVVALRVGEVGGVDEQRGPGVAGGEPDGAPAAWARDADGADAAGARDSPTSAGITKRRTSSTNCGVVSPAANRLRARPSI